MRGQRSEFSFRTSLPLKDTMASFCWRVKKETRDPRRSQIQELNHTVVNKKNIFFNCQRSQNIYTLPTARCQHNITPIPHFRPALRQTLAAKPPPRHCTTPTLETGKCPLTSSADCRCATVSTPSRSFENPRRGTRR